MAFAGECGLETGDAPLGSADEFGFAMILLLMFSTTSAFLATILPGRRGEKPLSPLWPYVTLSLSLSAVLSFVSMAMFPALH